MRNAVVLAKELATIDALSGGRLIAGLGIGWNRAEFENLGMGHASPIGGPISRRPSPCGAICGAARRARGRAASIASVRPSSLPCPRRARTCRCWIGATAEPALRRVGRIADGYQSTRTDAETQRDRAGVIGEAAAEAGRPMPTLSSRLSVSFDGSVRGVSILSGSPDEMAAQVRAYRDAGTEHLALDFGRNRPRCRRPRHRTLRPRGGSAL